MTVEEVLQQSGFTPEQIAALDQRAITAFGGVLSAAQQEREAAELAERSNTDFYENRIVPSLVQWDEERQRLENERARVAAEAAFYRTQAEEARKSGFIASDAPSFPARDSGGRYVAGAPGGTPGSPQYFDVNQMAQRAGDAIGIIADIQWEHEKLFGQKLPVSPSELIKQADALHLDPRAYAERQFKWSERRAELARAQQEAHDKAIREEATRAADQRWAERVGSNPDIRQPQANPRMIEISRGVKAGTVPDPLMQNEIERRQSTRQMIHQDIAEEQATR